MTEGDAAGVAGLAQRLQRALGDRYVVEEPLGVGGFAVVLRVHDVQLKRRLAVKVLSPDLIQSQSVLDRFRREAETIAQLSHPNIVPLHFVGDEDGLLYLAMRCVEGGSLADRVARKGPLPEAEARRILAEVAEALASAHRRGIVHRDIKPQNVLLDEDGRALVTDFGIARTSDSTLTATGMSIGTPAYLAPEQVTGEAVDHRADIYALGLMAFEVLTGRLPFTGPTAQAVMLRRLAAPPPSVREVRPEISPQLAETIARCLEVEPAKRIGDAAELARLFRDSSGDVSPAVRPGRGHRERWQFLAIAAVLAGAAAFAGVCFASRDSGRGATEWADAPTLDSLLIRVPSGTFTIGSDSGQLLARPAHAVTLAEFGIERTEVTVAAFAEFARASATRVPWDSTRPPDDFPVSAVQWRDASAYCAWKYPGRGRLPTEHEWEAAARGTAASALPWGGRVEPGMANTMDAGIHALVRVGSFPRGNTPSGLADMIGNVWEWTSSRLAPYPGGAALPDSMRQFMIIRGGAFNTPSRMATAWFRGYNRPAAAPADLRYTGFRCVASPLATER